MLMTRARYLVLLAMIWLMCMPALAIEIYVSPEGSDLNPGTTDRPVATLLRALIMVESGDTLLLADGTYTGTGNEDLVFEGKSVTLQATGDDALDCIIEGQTLRGLSFRSSGADGSQLKGLTIRGFGVGLDVHGATVTVEDCIIENAAGNGVVATGEADLTLIRCTVSGHEGVGIAALEAPARVELIDTDVLANGDWGVKSTCDRPVTVREGRIAENTAGGYYAASILGPVITGCEIADNQDNGIWVRSKSPTGARIVGCTISGNRRHGILYDAIAADQPGASSQAQDQAIIQGCTIRDNWEAGIRFGWDCRVDSYLVTECVIHDNRIAGIIIYARDVGRFELSGDTIAGNPVGVRIGTERPVSLEHSIIAYNAGPAVDCEGATSLDVMCCVFFRNHGGDWTGCVERQLGVAGNFYANPFLVDHLVGDYNIAETSPCQPGQHPDGEDCGLIGALGDDLVAVPATPGQPTPAGGSDN